MRHRSRQHLPFNVDQNDLRAYTVYLAIACAIALIAMLQGCKSAPQPVVQLSAPLDSAGNPMEEQYQIPVEHEDIEVPAGWDDSRQTAEIIIPPSDKPTTVYVRPKKRTIMEKIIPSRKQDTIEVVSTNKGVTTKQEKVTPWWWWFAGSAGGLGIAAFIIKRVWGFVPLTNAIGFIFTRLFKRG